MEILFLCLVFYFCSTSFTSDAFEMDLISNGGFVDPPYKYPWMVIFRRDSRSICGGALISRRFVLTAAHCLAWKKEEKRPRLDRYGKMLNSISYDKMSVGLGMHNKNHPQQTIKPSGIFLYPKHDPVSDVNLKYDIMLVELERSVKLNHTISPICLPPKNLLTRNFFQKSIGIIAGFGQTESEETSKILKTANVPIFSYANCKKTYGKLGTAVGKTDVCAGGSNEINACQGDSGTPLFIQLPNKKYHIIGVTSMGSGSCGDSLPVRYTSVAPFLKWINYHAYDLKGQRCGESFY